LKRGTEGEKIENNGKRRENLMKEIPKIN